MGACLGQRYLPLIMTWLLNNWGTILTVVVLAAVVALIVRYMIKNKKAGKSSCGAGCAHCAMHGECHKYNKGK